MTAALELEQPAAIADTAGRYPDWPGCLIRYAWLLEESNGRNLYTGADELARCKACGMLTPPAEQRAHRRQELAELARQRKQRARATQREATARLRSINRLRRETR